MMEREKLKKYFLQTNNINPFKVDKFPKDASFRSYERLFFESGSTMVLMDAPPFYETITDFINIDEVLRSAGLRAPEIYSYDIDNGFILLEDFGNNSYTKYLVDHYNAEYDIYKNAIDCLILLHNTQLNPGLKLPSYDKKTYIKEAILFADYFITPSLKNDIIYANDLKFEFIDIMSEIYDNLPESDYKDVLVLRDYHADNLHYLSGYSGPQSVGILDFQDALMGNNVYDLMSLIEDARRKIPEDIVKRLIEYYINETETDSDLFMYLYNSWAAQRNLKIIGIFNRKFFRDSDDRYMKYIPRVLSYLIGNITSTNLNRLREFIAKLLCDATIQK